MKKDFIKNFNLKKWGIVTLVAFMATVTGLTISSKVLTDKAVSAIQNAEPSTKAIISTDEEDFEETLANEDVEYTKIGNTTYVVDYGDSTKALEVIDSYSDNDAYSAEEDAIFVTASLNNNTSSLSDTEIKKVTESIPDGMTLRDYADSVGKKIVAVIDTGVDSNYAIASKNFTDNNDKDNNGHGTMVAKSILANANDKALILSLKAMNDDGSGYMSNIMQAIQYAREQHVDIINMSIATDASENKQDFVNLVTQAVADGIKVVASAGNYSSNALSYYPSGIEGVISVGSASDNGIKKDFSNYNADYYVNAESTSEAAGIVSGLLANENDLSELVNNSSIIMNSEEKENEDVSIGEQFYVQANLIFKFEGNSDRTWSGGANYNAYNGTFAPKSSGSISVPNKSGYSSSTWNCGGQTWSNGTGSWNAGTTFTGVSYSSMDTGNHSELTGTTGSITCSFVSGTLNKATYTATYDGNGGSLARYSDSVTVDAGSSYKVYVPNGSRTYYNLIGYGWAKDNNANVIAGKDVQVTLSAGNKTLYACWQGKYVTVHFNGNGAEGNVPGDQGFRYGTNGTLSWTKPTRTGYTFKNWNTSKDATAGQSDNSHILYNPGQSTYMAMSWANIIGDRDYQTLNLYAIWSENSYSINYNLNKGSGSTTPSGDTSKQTQKYTTSVNLHSAPTREGYIFSGWNTQADGKGKSYSAGQSVNKLVSSDGGSITLYAQWTPITYTISYNANGGTHVRTNSNTKADESLTRSSEVNQFVGGSTATATYTFDVDKNLTTNGFTWKGHTFLGWSENANATTATYTNSQSIKNIRNTNGAKVTLYAIWKTDNYILTINPVKGSGTWNGSSATKRGQDDTKLDGTGNTKWGDKVTLGEAVADDKSATITYDVNAGDDADSVVIDKTSETVKWVFSRWVQASGSTGRIFNNSARANDGSHDNGGTTYYIVQNNNDTVTAAYYWQTVTLPTPTREGYTFLGWYYDSNCTDKVDGRGAGSTKYPLDTNGEERKSEFQTTGNGGATFRTEGDITLYARWQKNSYDYSDTVQVFMQDDDDSTTGAFLRKIDALSLEPLDIMYTEYGEEGFILEIYKNSVSSSNLVLKLDTMNGLYNSSGTKLSDKTTDVNGWYDITGYLTDGTTYVVHESSAPHGYLLAKDTSFKFDASKKTQISIEDKEIYSPNSNNVTLTKYDIYSRPVAGAEFVLKDETTGKNVETFVSDENGLLTDNLPDYIQAGHKYSITETSAPEGYSLASTVYFTAPTYNGETMESIVIDENVKTAVELQIYKVSGSNDTPLEGATFQVFMKNADGELIPCYMNKDTGEWVNATEASEDVVLMTGTTGSDGLVSFKNLPLRASYTGSEEDYTKSYYIKEIKAPEGHALLTEIAEVRLPDDGSTVFRYTATDDSITLTLEAGGYGNQLILFTGGSLIVVGLFLAMKKRAKRNAN